MGHSQGHDPVGPRPYGEPLVAPSRGLGVAGVEGDELGPEVGDALDHAGYAALGDSLREARPEKMGLEGIGAEVEHEPGVGDIVYLHLLTPGEKLGRGLVVVSEGGVDQGVGRAEGPGEPAGEGLGGDVSGALKDKALGMPPGLELLEGTGHLPQGLIPRHPLEAPLTPGPHPLERVKDPVGVIEEVPPRLALGAHFAPAVGVAGVAAYLHQLAVGDIADDAAPGVALKAGAGNALLGLPLEPGDVPPSQAELHSLAEGVKIGPPGGDRGRGQAELQELAAGDLSHGIPLAFSAGAEPAPR